MLRPSSVLESPTTSSTFSKLLALLHEEHIRCVNHAAQDTQSLGNIPSLSSPSPTNLMRIPSKLEEQNEIDLDICIEARPNLVGHSAVGRHGKDYVPPSLKLQDLEVSFGFEQNVKSETTVEHHIYEVRLGYHANRSERITKQATGPVGLSPWLHDDRVSTLATQPADTNFVDRLVLHPNSIKLLFWDVVGMIMITYDLVFLPLQTFDIEENAWLSFFDWTSRVFWNSDILISFVRGYYTKGNLVMPFASTIRHYARTWLALDAALVLVDWSVYLVDAIGRSDTDTSEQSILLIRVLRIARVARMLRLLRLFKLNRIFSSVSDLISTEKLTIYFKFTKPLIGIIFLIHWMACGWYGIGKLGKENDWSHDWLRGSDASHRSRGFIYCTSLHWSLSQFTLSSIDVYAHNSYERLYTLAVLMFGVIAFSTLIGSFTSAVEQVRELRSEKTEQFAILRSFIRDHQISKRLTGRVFKYCEYAYAHRKAKLQVNDVQLLELVSEQLKQELAKEMHTPELTPHPLFRKMESLRYTCLDKICWIALRDHAFARGDKIFIEGWAPSGMIFFTDGHCKYVPTMQDVCISEDKGKDVTVSQGEWLCEPVLWTSHWLTYGKAKALVNSRVLFLDANWIERIFIEVGRTEWELAHRYAIEFVKVLNSMSTEYINDLLRIRPEQSDRNDDTVFSDFDFCVSRAAIIKVESAFGFQGQDSAETQATFASRMFRNGKKRPKAASSKGNLGGWFARLGF